jgi:hypothetical protein
MSSPTVTFGALAFVCGLVVSHWSRWMNPSCAETEALSGESRNVGNGNTVLVSRQMEAIDAPLDDVRECGSGVWDRVDTFVMFAGYPRSGHSLVATLLDAHPNLLIADEAGTLKEDDIFAQNTTDLLLRTCFERDLWKWSGFESADERERGRVHSDDGIISYNYSIPGMWQGRFSCLKVVGDKKGSNLPLMLTRDRDGTLRKLQFIRDKRLKLKWFHVIRNPFDNVATMTSQKMSWNGTHDNVDIVVDHRNQSSWAQNHDALEKKWGMYKDMNDLIEGFFAQSPDDVLHVYDPDLIANPHAEITRWCNFLGVHCSKQYLDACAKKIYKHTYRSRTRFEWDMKFVREIEAYLKQSPFLNRFTFDSD